LSKPERWTPITDIEPTDRARTLPDGRVMRESRITVSQEWIEQMWQGYRCAACLEDVSHLGPFPVKCPNDWCNFPIRAEQRARLEVDFVGQVEEMKRQGLLDREQSFLEEHFHTKKPMIHVPGDIRRQH
jgi:hypothetical protein